VGSVFELADLGGDLLLAVLVGVLGGDLLLAALAGDLLLEFADDFFLRAAFLADD